MRSNACSSSRRRPGSSSSLLPVLYAAPRRLTKARLSLAAGERATSPRVATAPQERREQRSRPGVKEVTMALALAVGFGCCCCSGAQDARYPGPVSGGGRAQERPAGWARGIAPSSLPAQGCAVSEPPEPCRGVGGQDARRPPLWGGLSLGYFSLAKQREVTRSPQASESSFQTGMRHGATQGIMKRPDTGSHRWASRACPEFVERPG